MMSNDMCIAALFTTKKTVKNPRAYHWRGAGSVNKLWHPHAKNNYKKMTYAHRAISRTWQKKKQGTLPQTQYANFV